MQNGERVWQANAAEIMPTDDGGFIVMLTMWEGRATRVARDADELRALLTSVEWVTNENSQAVVQAHAQRRRMEALKRGVADALVAQRDPAFGASGQASTGASR